MMTESGLSVVTGDNGGKLTYLLFKELFLEN